MCKYIFNILESCIEVPIFLLYFCFMFSDAVTTNLIMYRTCYITLGYNESDCIRLGTSNTNETLEKQVQPAASVLLMTQALCASIVPAVLILFIGPWIDRNGRRPVMLYALLGNLMTYVVLIIISSISWVSPWWWLITSFTTSLGGGESSLTLACICYITDITSEHNRGFRMGVFESSMSIGVLIGVTSSSFAFDTFSDGYIVIYSICASCTLLAILYIFIFIPETVSTSDGSYGMKELFKLSLIKDMYLTCVKPRENSHRAILAIIMLVLMLYMLAANADSQIFFLFLRDKFKWTLHKYTLYTSAYTCLGIFITLFGIYIFHQKLRINEIVLALFGFLAMIATALLYGLSTTDTGIFIAGLTRCFGGIIRPMLKTAISILIPADELGRVLTLTTSVESVTPLITGPIYTALYNNTLNTFSSAFNFITAGVLLLNGFILRCGPCQRIAPVFQQLSTKYPRAVFLKVDVDKCQETAAAQGVSAMPTFIFYRNRTKIDRLQGADPAALENKVQQYYGSDDAEESESVVAGHMDLNTFILKAQCECLNECDDHPLVHCLSSAGGFLQSDCDEQLIISLTFNQAVKIHSLKVKGPADKGPKNIKIFINQPRTLDFDMAESYTSIQELEFTPEDLEGNPVNLRYVKFQNVQNIQFFIKDNQSGGDVTQIDHFSIIGSPISTTNMGDFKRVAGKKGESH